MPPSPCYGPSPPPLTSSTPASTTSSTTSPGMSPSPRPTPTPTSGRSSPSRPTARIYAWLVIASSAALAATLDLVELAFCCSNEMLSRVVCQLVLKPARMAYVLTYATAGPLRYALAVKPLPGPAPYTLNFLEPHDLEKSPKLPPKSNGGPKSNWWLLDCGKRYSLCPAWACFPACATAGARAAGAGAAAFWLGFPPACGVSPPPPPGSVAPPARGKAPLAYALQVQRTHALQARHALPPQSRPPGLDRPPARGSARQAGRTRRPLEGATYLRGCH